MRLLLALLLLWSAVVPALAVTPGEMLTDPALEARARAISAELRCLVCQNQSIDDSDAPLARDLRLIVRERLEAGDSDTETIDHIVARYGEFVRLRPVLGPHTLLLWIAGPAALLAGIAALFVALRRSRGAVASGAPDLTEAERAALARLAGKGEPPG